MSVSVSWAERLKTSLPAPNDAVDAGAEEAHPPPPEADPTSPPPPVPSTSTSATRSEPPLPSLHGPGVTTSLGGLPLVVWSVVVQCSAPRDLLALGGVSKLLYRLTRSASLWAHHEVLASLDAAASLGMRTVPRPLFAAPVQDTHFYRRSAARCPASLGAAAPGPLTPVNSLVVARYARHVRFLARDLRRHFEAPEVTQRMFPAAGRGGPLAVVRVTSLFDNAAAQAIPATVRLFTVDRADSDRPILSPCDLAAVLDHVRSRALHHLRDLHVFESTEANDDAAVDRLRRTLPLVRIPNRGPLAVADLVEISPDEAEACADFIFDAAARKAGHHAPVYTGKSFLAEFVVDLCETRFFSCPQLRYFQHSDAVPLVVVDPLAMVLLVPLQSI